MNRERLGRLFQMLLLGSAGAGAASACGGSVITIDDGTPTNGPQTDPPTDPGTVPPTRTVDAGRDAAKDARVDVLVPEADVPDQTTWTCVTGQMDPDPSVCCTDPPAPGCQASPGGDQCALDCSLVCEKVSPGSSKLMSSCFWSASTTAPKINYYCGACGVGRVPRGAQPCARGEDVAERLAMQAYYEAASVIAFERLATVLEAAGAPEALVSAARAAGREERAHAALFSRLAERRGARVRSPEVPAELPSLFELALENAAEGCVRETYGALVALHQAEHAADPELRDAFRAVAGDEIAHAAFSWELAKWFEQQLGAPERAALASAFREAKRALRPTRADATDLALGLPEEGHARALFDRLFASLA